MTLQRQEAERKIYVKFCAVSCQSQLQLWREKVFKDDTAFQAKFIIPSMNINIYQIATIQRNIV